MPEPGEARTRVPGVEAQASRASEADAEAEAEATRASLAQASRAPEADADATRASLRAARGDRGARGARVGKRRRSRRARILRRIGVALGVVILLAGAGVGATALLVHNLVGANLETLPSASAFPAETGRPAPSHGAKNILLLGSDSRQKSTDHDLEDAGSQRADTMMLVHVSADRTHVSVMSVMRDLWVPVPGHGDAKINASLAWGGTPLAIQTLEQLLGARIDHVAIIDFAGLASMTTSLGGVYVDNPQPFTASRGADRFFPAGPIKLEGDRALTFARERYAFPTGDYQRVANQQLLLKGILGRALSRDVLADPRALADFASETSKNLTVDAGFTTTEMASLAYSLRGDDLANFTFFTMPTAGTGTADGQSIVKLDPAATATLRRQLATDHVP